MSKDMESDLIAMGDNADNLLVCTNAYAYIHEEHHVPYLATKTR